MNESSPNRNRKPSRKRGSGRSAGTDQKKTGRAKSTGQNAANKGGGNKKRGRNKQPKIDPAEFWGDPEHLPDVTEWTTSSPNVKAVVTSLGRPPVPGHETAAEHWLSLVYERSAVLASALAAAGGLDDPPDDSSAPESLPE
jgi:hypothetical protein